MAAQQMPPRPHDEAGEAEIEEATVLPEGKPSGGGQSDARTARGRRAMRVAVIVFVALGTGQYMQAWRPGAAAPAAAAAVPQQAALGLKTWQPVAAVVLTPVKPPESAPVTALAAAGQTGAPRPDSVADIVLASAMPGGSAPDAALPGDGFASPAAAQAGCAATLAVTAEPDAMLRLALAAPCHGGERVVVDHAGLSVTGRLDGTGRLALDLPALAADGAVSVVFADGARVGGAAAVPGLDGLRRVALQWRAGDDFSLHGLKVGTDIGAAGDVSEAQPGTPDGSGGWLVRLGAGDVAQPMLAEVFTYPADTSAAVEAAIVARVAPDSCGRRMEGQTIASVGGKAKAMQLTLAMPSCGGSSGYVVLRDLFGELQLAASE